MLFDNLLSWSTANGLKTPLQIRQNEITGYRYVVMDPTELDKLSTIPTPDSTTTTMTDLIDAPLSLSMTSKTSDGLADRLLFEQLRGEDSFYAPYLATLPSLESFQKTLPRFWKDDTARWEYIQADQGQLHAAVELDDERLKLSCDDWAQAVVDSRSHFVPPNGDEYALTPVLDMINHESSITTKMLRQNDEDGNDSDDDNDRIRLQIATSALYTTNNHPSSSDDNDKSNNNNNNPFLAPLQNFFGGRSSLSSSSSTPTLITPDTEVCMSYGSMPNVEFLLNYGFVPTDNPHNVETLEIPLIRLDKPIRVAVHANGQLDNLQPLRQALVNRQELEELALRDDGSDNKATQQSSDNHNNDTIISKRNELEVLALVGGTLEEAVYDLKAPIDRAVEAQDALVATYLRERQSTLQACLTQLQQEYPELFGY